MIDHIISIFHAVNSVLGSIEGDLIKKSFEFLLERESKESILRKFNLKVINQYFPEYEQEIKGHCQFNKL